MLTYELNFQTRWNTLNTMGARFELVADTLIYVGMRWHTSKAAQLFVHAHNSQSMPTYGLYASNALEVRLRFAPYT